MKSTKHSLLNQQPNYEVDPQNILLEESSRPFSSPQNEVPYSALSEPPGTFFFIQLAHPKFKWREWEVLKTFKTISKSIRSMKNVLQEYRNLNNEQVELEVKWWWGPNRPQPSTQCKNDIR